MIRQSGNILDIASAICSRSNRALGFVRQHRVHSLMKDLCRAANSCKAGLITGALRVACNGLCTAAILPTRTLDASWDEVMDWMVYGIKISVLPCSAPF